MSDPAPTPTPAGIDTPPASSSSWNQSILGEDGTFAQAWQDQLPDDFAEDRQMLSQFGDLRTLTKALKDNMATARSKMEGMVKLPGEKATDDERKAFLKALGVPDAPEGYGLKAPDKLPEGVGHDPQMQEAFVKVAHKIGLTPSQVKALADFQIGYVGEQVAAGRESAAKAIEAENLELAKRLGPELDKGVLNAQMLAVSEGLPKDVFDPQHEDFWGVEALVFASSVAAKLQKATGEDMTRGGAALANLSVETQANDLNRQAAEAYERGDIERSRQLAMQATELFRRAS